MNDCLKISKICVIGILIYTSWIFGAFGPQNIILYSLFLIATLCVGIDFLKTSKINKNIFCSILPLLILYALVSTVTGMLIAVDVFHFFKAIQNFIVYSIICFEINYISYKQRNTEWILKTFATCGFLVAVTNIFFGLTTNHVVTINVSKMSEFSNPNSEGFILVFGTFSILVLCKYKINILSLIYMCLAVYTIFIGASRKSLIAETTLLLYAFFVFFLLDLHRDDFRKNLKKILILVMVSLVALKSVDFFISSPIYQRLQLFDGGFNDRYRLIENALNLFFENPLFGVGFRQYEKYFEIYSHNTYFEILSCTGLVGASMWIYYFFRLMYRNYFVNRNFFISKNAYKFHFLFILILLFLGSGSILYYDLPSLVMLNYLFLLPKILEIQVKENSNMERS